MFQDPGWRIELFIDYIDFLWTILKEGSISLLSGVPSYTLELILLIPYMQWAHFTSLCYTMNITNNDDDVSNH